MPGVYLFIYLSVGLLAGLGYARFGDLEQHLNAGMAG